MFPNLLRLAAVLSLVSSTPIVAQSAAEDAPGSDAALPYLGYWGGYAVCSDRRSWVVAHHITETENGVVSDYRFSGASRLSTTTQIFASGQSLRFVPATNKAAPWTYEFANDQLLGFLSNPDCTSRLFRIPKADFDFMISAK